jgi:hypothetical protein
VHLSLSFANTEKEPVKILFRKPDLLGRNNQKIPAANIKIIPATLLLQPGSSQEAVFSVRIPPKCNPGTYSGLLSDRSNEHLRTVININVA